MILDAALNHALHVGIFRVPVGVAVMCPLLQALRPSLGALSLAALSSALFDAHPRLTTPSVSSCRGTKNEISPALLMSPFPPKLPLAGGRPIADIRCAHDR